MLRLDVAVLHLFPVPVPGPAYEYEYAYGWYRAESEALNANGEISGETTSSASTSSSVCGRLLVNVTVTSGWVSLLEPEPEPEPESGKPFPVFLQVGREVKKVVIEPGMSLTNLRLLFVDKFSYSPGQDNFPAIYIRDPSSGVQYELEDVDEVKDKVLLSLNIERQ